MWCAKISRSIGRLIKSSSSAFLSKEKTLRLFLALLVSTVAAFSYPPLLSLFRIRILEDESFKIEPIRFSLDEESSAYPRDRRDIARK